MQVSKRCKFCNKKLNEKDECVNEKCITYIKTEDKDKNEPDKKQD